MTYRLIQDVAREAAFVDLFIVDNDGSFEPRGAERVLRPGSNLGWLEGTNTGLRAAAEIGYDAYVMLNNDTRLSEGCMAGLVAAMRASGAGVIGPLYDGNWRHQLPVGPTAVDGFVPVAKEVPASFVDGTCMLISAPVLDRVGLLDRVFEPTGWGADIDYSMRATRAGFTIAVTHRCFVHHVGGATARVHVDSYDHFGQSDMAAGLFAKWGREWLALDPALRDLGDSPIHHRVVGRMRRWREGR